MKLITDFSTEIIRRQKKNPSNCLKPTEISVGKNSRWGITTNLCKDNVLFKFTHWKFLLRWGSHNVKELWQKTEAKADAKQVTSLNTLVTDRWIFWIQLFKILSITVFWNDDRWLSPLVLGMPTAKLHVYSLILSTEVCLGLITY